MTTILESRIARMKAAIERGKDDKYVNIVKRTSYSTWSDIMKNGKITEIQDPIMEMELNKHEFENIYNEIVCELQGNDGFYESYIDYYFTTNPVKSYVLSFKNEKRKTEFYNIGLEKKSVLSLVEVQEGEGKDEKEKRQENI